MTLATDTSPVQLSRVESEPQHFAFVDALCGFAILGVPATHAAWETPDASPLLLHLASTAAMGVQLFFVISGLTLFHSLHQRSRVDQRPICAFFIRRLFRIAPLFWIATVFYLWWPVVLRENFAPFGVAWPHIVTTLLFIQSWHPSTIASVFLTSRPLAQVSVT